MIGSHEPHRLIAMAERVGDLADEARDEADVGEEIVELTEGHAGYSVTFSLISTRLSAVLLYTNSFGR